MKYGSENDRAARREQKRLLAEQEKNLIWWPDRSRETFETVDKTPVGYGALGMVTQRVVKYSGTNEIIEFAVTSARRASNGDWMEVLCIDTCHYGTVHRHRNGDHRSEPEHITQINDQKVFHDEFWKALDEVFDAVDWEG